MTERNQETLNRIVDKITALDKFDQTVFLTYIQAFSAGMDWAKSKTAS